MPAKLKVNPSDIVVESSDPNTTFIQVYNANNDTPITWSASSNENWLELSVITGATPDLIYLNVDTSQLSEGFYSAIVTIWNSAHPTESFDVNVYLTMRSHNIYKPFISRDP